ncbi:MAG: flagellar hook-associated protein FlgL [Pseudomonadales bacterium]|jgi:flagellar hook-associated protein 3 FlgL|tara:strand:+ start:6489 stop:7745 length:1257 start_codon:yes stop_codon:yes gene_type:complete
MKISTSLNYQRALANIQNTQAEVSKTREQVATGKVMVRPSDDPTKVATIENLDRAIAKTDTYSGLIGDLKQRYELEETVLLSGSDILVRLKELAIQASNDTLSSEDRGIVALEVAGLKKELLNIANTQDISGSTIFAGGNTGLQPFATLNDGSVTYQGDARQIQVSVSDTRDLTKNRNGLDVFAPAERELVAAVAAQYTQAPGTIANYNGVTTITDGLNTLTFDYTGGAPVSTALLINDLTSGANEAAYADFKYTITDNPNNPGELLFTAKTKESVAAVNVPLLVAAGATDEAATATEAVAGLDRTTQGIAFFTALEDFVTALNSNDTVNIRRAIGEVGGLHEGLVKAIGRVGSEIQSAETQLEMNADSKIRLQTLLSGEEDLDYSEALTRFNEEMTRLEATQATFAKVARLSLFEYL